MSGVGLLVAVLISVIVVPVIVSLLSEEALAQMPRVAMWFIRSAVGRLPACERERYLEEWTAEVASAPGPLSKIAASLSIRTRGLAALAASLRAMNDRSDVARDSDSVHEPSPMLPIQAVAPTLPIERVRTATSGRARRWPYELPPPPSAKVVALSGGLVSALSAAVTFAYLSRGHRR